MVNSFALLRAFSCWIFCFVVFCERIFCDNVFQSELEIDALCVCNNHFSFSFSSSLILVSLWNWCCLVLLARATRDITGLLLMLLFFWLAYLPTSLKANIFLRWKNIFSPFAGWHISELAVIFSPSASPHISEWVIFTFPCWQHIYCRPSLFEDFSFLAWEHISFLETIDVPLCGEWILAFCFCQRYIFGERIDVSPFSRIHLFFGFGTRTYCSFLGDVADCALFCSPFFAFNFLWAPDLSFLLNYDGFVCCFSLPFWDLLANLFPLLS